jgi:ABC-2 type transport system permease protein
VSRPATLTWFAGHEMRLVWRDWITFRTSGKRSREKAVMAVAVIFVALIHVLAEFMIAPMAAAGMTPDKATLVTITGAAFLSWTLMLSQAIESVTRAFYARADLDLILSSPASARRLFAVRMVAVAIATTVLTTLLAAPFINILAFHDGARWLAGYGVLCAMGALSTAVAIVISVALFRGLGPRRTRLVSQVVSAVVAAAFVIGVQAAAIVSTGSISRLSLFRSENFVALTPEIASPIWWPARAAMGDPACRGAVLAVRLGLLALVIARFSASFAAHVGAAAGETYQGNARRRRFTGFRPASTKRVLRRKEWMLVRRDPWLMSQTLMQIFYLLPPALILWLSFGDNLDSLLIVVPILVMAAGQLAGGLSWLVVSGEDAPDLVASAPIPARAIISAKIEFVLGGVMIVVAPLLVALALAAPAFAAIAAFGIAVSAASGTMIQFWFRGLARRHGMRRRQIPSRLATLAEALSAILWAGTAALVAAGSWLATVTAMFALLALAGIWMIRPRQDNAA